MKTTIFRDLFLKSSGLLLKKSRRYQILNGQCEIDGYSAVLFFLDTGCDYRKFYDFCQKNTVRRTIHNPRLYDFEMSPRHMSANLLKLMRVGDLSYGDLFKLIGLDDVKGLLLLGRGDALPLSICLKIERIFGASLPLWFSQKLDVDCLVQNWRSVVRQRMHLPSPHNIGLGSKVRIFESAISYVSKKMSFQVVTDVLLRMQIHRDLFLYPDKAISLNTFNEYHTLLRHFGADDDFYIEMGGHNAYSNKISKVDFKQRLNPASSMDALEKLGLLVTPRVDLNYSYEVFDRGRNYIMISSKPRQEMVNAMGTPIIGSYEVALYRFGHILTFPVFFDFPPANKELSYMEYDKEVDGAIFKIVV